MPTTTQHQGIEGMIQTYISADVEKLYERDFLAERTQTAYSRPLKENRLLKEQWSWISPRVSHPYGYDPVIVRFYEDIIVELQRELARYKAMVVALLASPSQEEDVQYFPGEPVHIPRDLARKLQSRTKPGLPMTGYEI